SSPGRRSGPSARRAKWSGSEALCGLRRLPSDRARTSVSRSVPRAITRTEAPHRLQRVPGRAVQLPQGIPGRRLTVEQVNNRAGETKTRPKPVQDSRQGATPLASGVKTPAQTAIAAAGVSEAPAPVRAPHN